MHETFVESCLSTSGATNKYEQIYEFRRMQEKLGPRIIIDDEAQEYLQTFGYLRAPQVTGNRSIAEIPVTGKELRNAIMKFQKFIGIPQSGTLDDPTREKMLLKRCALKDSIDEAKFAKGKNLLWNKSIISWNISTFPSNLPKSRTREAFEKMFEVWRSHTVFDFVEVGDKNNADISITFDSASSRWPRDPTHTAIAHATGPVLSRISLNNDTIWSYNGDNNENSTEIVPVILHAIGHVLGLDHSNSPDSIMYPIFEHRKPLITDRSTGVPKLNDIDIVAIRQLYGLSATTTSATSSIATTVEPDRFPFGKDCPKEVEAATEVNDATFIFRGGYVWQLRGREVKKGALRIGKLFPEGPNSVNASVTRGDLTVLIHERTLYGYIFDQTTGAFRLADGWPKELHGRVVFLPEAAFPLSNGSVVLISGDVFATYDFDLNRPSLIDDKNVFFPNLPDEMRSGIPLHRGSDDLYRLFGSDTVYEYDSRIHEIISAESLKTYVICP
uniref:Matrix metalloproteinase-19 n=1 Tax=Ascaris suum TaxID=6253 RepID=F1L4T5_ASCSU